MIFRIIGICVRIRNYAAIYYNALTVGNPIDCAIPLKRSRYSNSSDFQPTEFLFIYFFTAQVLKVCRTPGPTACTLSSGQYV